MFAIICIASSSTSTNLAQLFVNAVQIYAEEKVLTMFAAT